MNYEYFRPFKDDIEVSDYGYVRKNGEELPWHKDQNYYFVCFNGEAYRIHQLVGEVFQDICGEHKPGYHLHHKNGNQLDNRATNLVWLSPGEHRKLHLIEDGDCVAVKAYDLKGNFVGDWDCALDAATETGSDRRHIIEIISGKTRRFSTNKLYWFKGDLSEEEIEKKISEIKLTKNQGNRKK